MSKRCELRCACGAEWTPHISEWCHRELANLAANTHRIGPAVRELRGALKPLEQVGWKLWPVGEALTEGLHWVADHYEHGTPVCFDEYGDQWPCECAGDHTGPCKGNDMKKLTCPCGETWSPTATAPELTADDCQREVEAMAHLAHDMAPHAVTLADVQKPLRELGGWPDGAPFTEGLAWVHTHFPHGRPKRLP